MTGLADWALDQPEPRIRSPLRQRQSENGTPTGMPAEPPRGHAPDAGLLASRIDALTQFRRIVSPYLPPERLQPVVSLADQARQRLTICPELTVVALAGPTGSGKSSIFNALAGQPLSPVGVRRPTTGVVHACVWGSMVEASPLLDWLKVLPESRFAQQRPFAGDALSDLDGLVLLDLPDFDSLEREHASEVERLLGMVDLVVWVLDPQKYADQVVHERYLRPFSRHRDVMVVALNQTDLLSADDAGQLLADLRGLLDADGLAGVRTMATSAVDLPAGLAELRSELRGMVSGRQVAWQRLGADVDQVVDGLADLVGPPVTPDAADRAAFGELADGLADATGVTALADAAESRYRERAVATAGSPLLRWLAKTSQSPARAGTRAGPAGTASANTGTSTGDWSGDETDPDPSINSVSTSLAVGVAVRLAVRTVAVRASEGLPAPWPEAIWRASRTRLPELPTALAGALAAHSTHIDAHTTRWWRLVGVAQWTATIAAGIGLVWQLVSGVMRAVSLPVTDPAIGPITVPLLLLFGGVLTMVAGAAVAQPLLTWAARRIRIRVRRDLRAAVAEVGREQVVVPVREVLGAYAEARAALHVAAGVG